MNKRLLRKNMMATMGIHAAAPGGDGGDGGDGEQSFVDAFSEFVGAGGAGDGDGGVPADGGDDPKDAGDEPAPGGDKLPADDGSTPPSGDPWAEAPENLRTEYQRQARLAQDLAHRIQSDNGRVAAYQRQVDELKQQMQSGRQSAGTQPADRGAQQQPAPASQQPPEGGGDQADALASLREDWPEAAEAIETLLAKGGGASTDIAELTQSLHSQISDMNSRLEPVLTQHQVAAREAAMNDVELAHPGWTDLVNDSHFNTWQASKSESIRALAASEDPRDAISLLSLYKAESGILPDAPAEPGGEQNNRRDARQRRAASVSKPAGRVNKGDDGEGTFEDYFKVYANADKRA